MIETPSEGEAAPYIAVQVPKSFDLHEMSVFCAVACYVLYTMSGL
jgi:hypothetical protein